MANIHGMITVELRDGKDPLVWNGNEDISRAVKEIRILPGTRCEVDVYSPWPPRVLSGEVGILTMKVHELVGESRGETS